MNRKGFTLIEVLVVLLLIGILSAIALPTFLSYPSRARETEALTLVRAGINAQQSFYLEYQDFAPTSEVLGLAQSTNNYKFSVFPLEAPDREATAILANPINKNDKAFLGAVATVVSRKAIKFSSAICESEQPVKNIKKLLDIRARKLKCKGEV